MAAMKSRTTMFMMMMFMVASMQMHSSMAQTRHVVGDALGWTIPTGDAYTTWASQQTFNVGDTIFFNFTTGIHDVAEVSQAAYDPCTTANPISLTTTGPATLTLTTAGAHYYICTVSTHCQIGQKLTINVSAATATPPTTTPPPASPPATPPTTTPTTPPPTPVTPPTTTPSPAPVSTTTTTPPPTTSSAPSPVGATPPSPNTSGSSPSDRPTPSPTSDTTPPPPAPTSASRAFTAVVPATFLAVALALLY